MSRISLPRCSALVAIFVCNVGLQFLSHAMENNHNDDDNVIVFIMILGPTYQTQGVNISGNKGTVPSEGEGHSKYSVCIKKGLKLVK
jgi:hypothetical protein